MLLPPHGSALNADMNPFNRAGRHLGLGISGLHPTANMFS